MPWNGAGVYQPVSPPDFPAVAATVIRATQYNNQINDLASALANVLTRDGQGSASANLPMNGFKFTNVGVGAVAGDSVNFGQVRDQGYLWGGTAGGTANALTIAPTPTPTAWSVGQTFRFKSGPNANSGATTLTIPGGPAAAIALQVAGAALQGGEIQPSQFYEVFVDTAGTGQLTPLAVTAVLQDALPGNLYAMTGTDTITATARPTLTKPMIAGTRWSGLSAGANATAVVTLNVDAQGAMNVVRPDGTALRIGDIPAANYPCKFIRRAADIVLENPANVSLSKGDCVILKETKAAPAIAAGALTLDLSAASLFDVSLNGAITTFTLSNPPASGTPIGFSLIFTADGTARAVTWPASVKWANGIAPTLTSTLNKQDVFTFITRDGGTSYLGFVSGQNL